MGENKSTVVDRDIIELIKNDGQKEIIQQDMSLTISQAKNKDADQLRGNRAADQHHR